MGRRQLPRLRPRILRRSGPAFRLPTRNPARGCGVPQLVRSRPHAPPVPSPAPRRNHQARHHRRAAPRHQARSAQPRPILRHAFGRQPRSPRALQTEPLHSHPPASLQPRRNPARPRHRPVHQRPASLHLRAKKQPHQADGGRRSPTVSARPQPAREIIRVRPLRRPLRARRKRNPLLHPPQRQNLLVSPLQPRLERRRWQPAQSQRTGYRLPVARSAPPREPDQHLGKLRPSSRVKGREDGQKEADPNLAALPSTRRSAPPANRRAHPRRGPALPNPTLGRQRQEQLHRLAGPPTNRPRKRQRSSLRLNHRRHRPPHPRPPDPRHHQAVLPSVGDSGTRRPLGRPAPIHRERQEDHHLDDPEIPLYPRRNRQPTARAALRHHHRRSPLQPRRPHRCRHGPGALRGRCRRGRRNLRGPDQPHDGVAQATPQRQLLRLHRHPQEQDAGNLRCPSPAGRRQGQSSRLPQLHHEAGDPRGVHPRRARPLHACAELLQTRQDRRGRPRVRRQ